MYRPLGWLVVRTPMLPVEDYLRLSGGRVATAAGSLLPDDSGIQRALAVGASELLPALERPAGDPKTRRRVEGKLLRYLIRMSTRATPLGLFAGVSLARWGDATTLERSDEQPRTRTRPDMGWLLGLVSSLEQRPEIRAGLRLFTNPAVVVHADRVFLSQRAPIGNDAGKTQRVSIRASAAVRRVLTAAEEPIGYHELIAGLRDVRGATQEKAERLVAELLEQTVLLTELRPPLTVPQPARYVAERLAEIPAAHDDAAALTELLDELDAWDKLEADQATAGYPKLVAKAESLRKSAARGPFQTDAVFPLSGARLHHSIGTETARAVELLLRLSPHPEGLTDYRRRFEKRYGHDREVPLLELLDPELGLGAPKPASRPETSEQRSRVLMGLATKAIRDRQMVQELDEQALGKLEASDRLPPSLDIAVTVVADSPAAVDRGDFQLVVAPILGIAGAGRTLGRFADVLGPEGEAALVAAAADQCPGQLPVEVVALPPIGRHANVTVRPLVQEHQLVLGTTPAGGTRIRPADVVVGLRDGRFVVRWTRTGQELAPYAGHMLRPDLAPSVAAFLEAVSEDGRVGLHHFDWGPAASLPFLPRVRSGRIVLAPARWSLYADQPDIATPSWIEEQRREWQLPRHVYLTSSDNRLLVDLDDPAQVEELCTEARRRSGRLTLQEALPGPEHAWLPGPGGRYMSEVVVPLVRDTEPATVPTRRPPRPVPTGVRLRPPGSDWLYLKLYHLPTFEDDLIGNELRTFCAGTEHSWFFVRYLDPEPHLRIRWHGDPDRLMKFMPDVLGWASRLIDRGICRSVSLDSYDREIERYGGPAATTAAEELFAADSHAVADLLHLLDSGRLDVDRDVLAAYTIDDLLTGLGFDDSERIGIYRESTVDRRATGDLYRKMKGALRNILGDPGALPDILSERRAVIEKVAERLREGELGQPLPDLARSFVHMHCNRLLGCGHPPEQRVLGLLLRTAEGLRRAPAGVA